MLGCNPTTDSNPIEPGEYPLTDDDFYDGCATVSPDGNWVAFISRRGSTLPAVWKIPTTGGTPQLVFEDDNYLFYYIDWGPDNSQIVALVADLELSDNYIVLLNIITGDIQHLIPVSTVEASPSISPDGSLIVYVDSVGFPKHLYLYNIDSSEITNLLWDPNYYPMAPEWSPDNETIVFTYYSYNPYEPNIWTIEKDGSGLTQLTEGPNRYLNPTWSPDGEEICFVSSDDPEVWGELCSIPSTGGDVTVLTESDSNDYPCYVPGEKDVVFISNRNHENGDVWLLKR